LAVGKKERSEETVQLTYKELNEKSYQLAEVLREKGVRADNIVGIMLERSVEMIIGILGILKAGGAYLPIDPGYPRERIDYMLKDSGAGILLTNLSAGHHFHRSSNQFSTHHPGNLAYVIYTSGSTGKPRGVMVNHCPVVNILTALQRMYPFKETDAYLGKTSYLFDVSVIELFGWFLGGGRLVLLEKGGERDPGKILAAVEYHRITHINFVPTMFNVFADELREEKVNSLGHLRYIFLAGEALPAGVVDKFAA
jgi:non-ribosomal peptide synthetase component F